MNVDKALDEASKENERLRAQLRASTRMLLNYAIMAEKSDTFWHGYVERINEESANALRLKSQLESNEKHLAVLGAIKVDMKTCTKCGSVHGERHKIYKHSDAVVEIVCTECSFTG
jgi:uncharacterized membrane-anchored protein